MQNYQSANQQVESKKFNKPFQVCSEDYTQYLKNGVRRGSSLPPSNFKAQIVTVGFSLVSMINQEMKPGC